MVMVTLKLQRYFVIYKKSPLKMEKIKKTRSPSTQLLETIFTALIEHVIGEEMHDVNLPKNGEMPKKWLFWLKNQKIS